MPKLKPPPVTRNGVFILFEGLTKILLMPFKLVGVLAPPMLLGQNKILHGLVYNFAFIDLV